MNFEKNLQKKKIIRTFLKILKNLRNCFIKFSLFQEKSTY